jgi:GR25 family glycosyltransferase involved in LPS biosynthesis
VIIYVFDNCKKLMSPFDFFDKIVCISFNPERWEKCLYVFKQLGIADRVTRYYGTDPLKEYIKRGCIPQNFDPSSHDVIHARRGGCTLSHFNVIKLAKEENCKNVLTLEDDIEINGAASDVLDYLEKALQELPQNWEMLYLGCNPVEGYGSPAPVVSYSDRLCKVFSAFTTHAVAVNSNVFDVIIENSADMDTIIQWVEQRVGIDVFYCRNMNSRGNTFMPRKLLINQQNCFSGIDNCIRNNGDFIKQAYNKYKELVDEQL